MSALRQFGLVNTVEQGKVQLSETGRALAIASDKSRAYQEALQDAALRPNIFSQLHEMMPEASDESLRHELILVRNFSEDGAKRLINAYRASLSTAGLDADDDEHSHEEEDVEHDSENRKKKTPPSSNGTIKLVNVEFRFFLREGVQATVSLQGTEIFTADDIEVLKEYLDVAKKSSQRIVPASVATSEIPIAESGNE